MIDIIKKYFPSLTTEQEEQFNALNALYHEWNAKINVISRKDIDNLYEHHILHSLAIAKVINFRDGTNVLDFGTGGGFLVFHLLYSFLKLISNSLMVLERRCVLHKK